MIFSIRWVPIASYRLASSSENVFSVRVLMIKILDISPCLHANASFEARIARSRAPYRRHQFWVRLDTDSPESRAYKKDTCC